MERARKEHDSHQSGTSRRVAQARSSRSSPQKDLASGIDSSPLMVAQRRKLQSLFGGAAQLQDEPISRPNNTGLPDNLKSGIESLSGMSMDHVKVHYNSSKPAQLNALAYAQGSDIHVAPGQEKHLPHEAWHVVQQAQGRVKPTMQMKGGVAVNDDKGLEHEADAMGEKANSQDVQGIERRVQYKQLALVPEVSDAEATAQRVRVARFMDVGKKTSFFSPAAQQSEELHRKKYFEIVELIKNGSMKDLLPYLEGHAQGDSDANSPFISVARNFVSLSYSTDDSENGVESILQNAPDLVHFDVPDNGTEGVYLLPAMNELSLGETELLVLLPPSVSLMKYLIVDSESGEIQKETLISNPYLKMTPDERDAFNKKHGLERTKFVVSDEDGLQEVAYDESHEEGGGGNGATIEREDLTDNEILYITQHVVDNLGIDIEKFNSWKEHERKQKLDDGIQEYLEYVNKNPDKRKL